MNQFLILKKLKTLLIDDNVIVRDTVQMIFARKGCLIKAYETAEEGLQALEKERFDIIISDLKLPGIDGVEFFKRAMRSHPDTVRILISGYGDQSTISEAFEIGVHALISKPFSLTAFLEKLMPYVENRHDRESQSNNTAATEAAPENQNQAQTADNNINGSRFSKSMLAINLISCLPPDSKKKTATKAIRYNPSQVTD